MDDKQWSELKPGDILRRVFDKSEWRITSTRTEPRQMEESMLNATGMSPVLTYHTMERLTPEEYCEPHFWSKP